MVGIERVRREREFYEKVYSDTHMDFNARYELIEKVFYGMNLLGAPAGKLILDLCSGRGVATYHLAMRNWDIISADLSYNAMKVSMEFIKSRGLSARVHHVTSAAEHLPFKDSIFDCIFCNGGLHHTDIALTAKETGRILKEGGTGVFIETSAYNPVLMFARIFLTGRFGIPKRSTSDEHPLRLKDLNTLKDYFREVKIVKSFHFFSMAGRYLGKRDSIFHRTLLFIDRFILKLAFTKRLGYWIIIKVKK